MHIKDIDIASLYDYCMGYLNCSDSVFYFHLNILGQTYAKDESTLKIVLLHLTMVHPDYSPKNSLILILLTDERSTNHTCRKRM